MKKIISVLLAMILCMAPITAFAATEIPEEISVMMGDLTGDKKVNAADARIVLRISAKIESSEGVALLSADANGDKKINAADARIILRVAANMTEFVYGFDGNGMPCALNVLKSDKYCLDAAHNDGNVSISLRLACNGNNVYMLSDDVGDISGMGFSGAGMMVVDGEFYALLTGSSSDIAMYVPDSMLESMGSQETIFEIKTLMGTILPEEAVIPTKTEVGGETVYCYSYGGYYLLYVSDTGKLIKLEEALSTDSAPLMTFNDVSADNIDDYFNLDNYDLM